MKEVVVYQAKPKTSRQVSREKIKQILRLLGTFLILVSFLGLIFTFGPLLKSEIIYRFKKQSKKIHFGELIKKPPSSSPLSAPDPYFSLAIPKIEARSKILSNIDASNQNEYLSAL